MAGAPHKDRQSGEQLSANTVIVQQMERWEAPTEINESGWAMKTIGSDKAIIFSQGKQINGTWKKQTRKDRTIFYDDEGKEVAFIPGQFWIEVVPPEVFAEIKVKTIPEEETGSTN